MPQVFYAVLKERQGVANDQCLDSVLGVVEHNARLGYRRLAVPYLPPAHARNAICQEFLKQSQDAEDVVVMMDADHQYPPNVVERLAGHGKGVVAALAASKGLVPFLCAFKRAADGQLYNLTEWERDEVAECTVVGTGCIAIRRWVLEQLEHCKPSWFRYLYGGYAFEPTEDMYFGYECEKAGIPHYIDTGVWIPHLTWFFTTPNDWKEWIAEHPEARRR